MIRITAMIAIMLLAGGNSSPAPSFSALSEEFVYTTLAFSPVSATATGYHRHQGVSLDEQLDDFTPASLDRQRRFYAEFRKRLAGIDAGALAPEDRADYDIIQDQISMSLLELDEIRSYRNNPTIYVELIGNALFSPYVLEYAPLPQRMSAVIARVRKIPALVDQAKKNLESSPAIWTTVAAEENEGNIGLIDKTLRDAVPQDMRAGYDGAARSALEALRSFQAFLKDDLSKRDKADWRLGSSLYARKFRYSLATDLSPDQVLASAEADVHSVRSRMLEVARPLYRSMFPDKAEPAQENKILTAVLGKISERHATPATYMDEAKADLAEAHRFAASKHLLTLPSGSNLQVIETPEFMRGIYAVGGFNQAPALEPQLGAFYWVTPIPPAWPPARIDSKLREYNFYKLKLLTIHEAMPGHYVQFEFANNVQPKTRRIIRAVFGNTPYVEGWAQYATQMMLDNGFLDNSPELRLTFQKEELRVLANAIIDIRLQTMRMTDQQAVDLMERQTFQEKEEATAKLQRAQLSSCQLPAYLVGWRDWIRVREQYRKFKGADYSLAEFNDQALKEGAVPLPVLGRLLTGKPLGVTGDGGRTSLGISGL